VPWNSEFTWEAFNYAPLTVGIVILGAAITWLVSARKHFTGQIRETDIEAELGDAESTPPLAP
jgi:hypothetical protein